VIIEQPEAESPKISARRRKTRKRHPKPTAQTYVQGQTGHLDCDINTGRHVVLPGKAFMRFTWKDKIIANGVGHLDRFLPTGLLIRSGWRIGEFIRNDNHADVYSVSNKNISHYYSEAGSSLEAHAFLDEYHGNSGNYANRHKRRMRRGGCCLESFWLNDRHVLIIRIQKEMGSLISRNYEEEFPDLVDQKV
jgi:hypothetical protein